MIKMIPVVAGIIFNLDGKVLIAQRETLEWEFPGGKVEPGEEPEEALKRELQEEIGLSVVVFRPVHVINNYNRTEGYNYIVIFYKCYTRFKPGKGQYLWVSPFQVGGFDLIHPRMLEALFRADNQ